MKRVLLALPFLLTGCGVTRDGALSPSVNDCVAALPVAQALVGPKAHLQILRRDPLAQVQAVLRSLDAPPLTPEPSRSPGPGMTGPRPCVLVFTGSFAMAALRTAPGHPAADAVSGAERGGYALVISTTRHPRVLRAVVALVNPIR